ncbi:MAG: glycosyltransferase [Bacteroidales bacterium]|nr:glycosyltransferase [Bacteroidales bacterium]
MKKIIITSAHDYSSPIQIGNHHFARLFAKHGYEVLFLSNPITPFHRFSSDSDSYQMKKRKHQNGGEREGNIVSYVPASLLTPRNIPLLSSKWTLWNWDLFSYPSLTKKIDELGFSDVDIIWMESLIFAPILKKISHKKMICRIADDLLGFEHVSNKIFQNELQVLKRADNIIFSSPIIMEKYRSLFKENSLHYIENGIDVDNFIRADYQLPDEYKSIPSPRVIYVGSIENWFDEELVAKCAQKLKDVNFIIIGPETSRLNQLKPLRNVHLLGAKTFNSLPNYLFYADVGFIPFDTKTHKTLIDGVNPLKLYEYLACGLTVLSTKWKTLEELNPPIFMSDDSDDFIHKLEIALKAKKSQKSIDYALGKSWEKIFEKVQKFL